MRQYILKVAFVVLNVLLIMVPFGAGVSSVEDTLQIGRPEDVGISADKLQDALAVMEHAVEDGLIPGGEIMIVRQGVIVAHQAFGHAMQYPTRQPMTKNTLFDVASITKLFTATAVMILLERGELRLDDTVGQFLPHRAFTNGDKKHIRLRHLLTHTSGLPAWIAAYRDGEGKEHYLEAIAETPLRNEPGEAYAYSDLGAVLLGFIVEDITGQRLDEFLQHNVFTPLGMTNTLFNPQHRWHGTIAATEWDTVWRCRLLVGEVHDENAAALGGIAGHAGLFSTAHDMAAFGQMFLNLGRFNGHTVLSPHTVLLMTQNHTLGDAARRGLGFDLRSLDRVSDGTALGTAAYGHNGFTGTSLWIDPAEQLIVVMLTNAIHPQREQNNVGHVRTQVHRRVMDALVSLR